MQQAFRKHMKHLFPFVGDSYMAIAVSGGIDSMVLLHLCHSLSLNISVLHCNFRLRARASVEDEIFIKNTCKKLKISFYAKAFDTETYAEKHKLSIQMAARELRYQWFDEQKAELGFDYLLTAHHADDNLETFLINLIRGTGLEGLTGIPEANDYIIRPLLPFSRDEISTYAKKHIVLWREDSSNAETKYLRNKLRHDVVPILKEMNPMLLQNFSKTTEHLGESAAILKVVVDEKRKNLFRQKEDGIEISIAELKTLFPLAGYLYELFKPYGFTNKKDLQDLLDTQSGKQLFSKTHRLLRNRAILLLLPLNSVKTAKEYEIAETQQLVTEPIKLSIEFVVYSKPVTKSEILLDKETLKFPLKLRKWQNGDYFYPFGMKGKKKLSKFFKDEKFSLADKENQWLLCNNDDAIVWVVGHRADDRFKVTERTKEIIKITSLNA